MVEQGLLRPTHKPSTSASSYLLITRRPSSTSLSPTPRKHHKLKRPYPLAILSIIDLALILHYARGTQRIIGLIRFATTAVLVGCSRRWRARHGAVLFVSLGSLVFVLWETCQAVMAGERDWNSPALIITTCFSIIEYLAFVLALRISPLVTHFIRYETESIPTPRTPSRRNHESEVMSEHEEDDDDDDDASSISSSEIVDLPPPLSPARLRLDVDPVRLVRRRSARFFGGGSSDVAVSDEEEEFGLGEEEDRLGRTLSRSWRRRSALEAEGYGTFR